MRAWVAAVAVCLVGSGCAGAERPAGLAGHAVAPAPAVVAGEGRVAVVPDPDASAVAVALVAPGSAWELPGTEGLTHLAARSLIAEMEPALETLGARARVTCGRAAFTFTLLAPVDGWEAALSAFMDGLLRPAIGAAALDRARTELVAELRLDDASPAWQARLAARQALYGDTLDYDPWAAAPCGLWESLGRFSLAEVRAGAHRFDRERVTVALTGPVDPSRAVSRLDGWVSGPGLTGLPSPYHTAPNRRYVERNTVTAWVAVAFPFPADRAVEPVRLVGALVEAEVGPGVERSEVYDAGFEVERHGSGGALVVHVTVEPDSAGAYAERVAAAVRRIADGGVPDDALARATTAFRGRRLLARAEPESRMASLALDLALGDRDPGAGWPSPTPPDPVSVREAAASLGAPAVAVVGPRRARGGGSP